MESGVVSNCPCGACHCVLYTDSWHVVSRVWFHGGEVLAFWEEGYGRDGRCPECDADLLGDSSQAISRSLREERDAGQRWDHRRPPDIPRMRARDEDEATFSVASFRFMEYHWGIGG